MVISRGFCRGLLLLGAALVACGGGEQTPMSDGGGPDGPDASWTAVAVGPAGGSFTFAGGKVKLEVPPGALAQETAIKVMAASKYPADSRLVAGTVYDLLPDGAVFKKAVKLSIAYDSSKVPAGATEAALRIHRVASGAWKPVGGGGVDTAAAVVWDHIDGFSTYGIKGRSPTGPDGTADVAIDAAVPKDGALSDGTQSDAPTKQDATKPDMKVSDAPVPDAAKPPATTCPGHVNKAGWCWHRPLPQGNSLNDVACAGNRVYIVGMGGTVLTRDGKSWKPVSLSTQTNLKAVWGASASDMHIGGGAQYHYNGKTWSLETLPKPTGLVRGIHGNGSGSVWTVGHKGTMWHKQGANWSSLSPNTTKDLLGIWAVGNKTFAVGSDGLIFHNTSLKTKVNAKSLEGVWGSSTSDIYAVGRDSKGGGVVFHHDGAKWAPQAPGTTWALSDIWGSGPKDIYAVGSAGTIIHNAGAGWQKQSSGSKSYLYGVGGCGPSEVYAVGAYGTILRSDGKKWVEQSTSTKFIPFAGIWGASSSDVFAVGGGNDTWHVQHYDGKGWKEQSSGSGRGLLSVWGTGSTNVYAVGYRTAGTNNQGVVLRYNGKQWADFYVPKGVSRLYGVWVSPANTVFAVGTAGAVLRYEGAKWSMQVINTGSSNDDFYTTWGTSSTNVYAGGYGGLYRFDGSAWKQEKAPPPSNVWGHVYGIWGTSPTNVFVASQYKIFRFDGTTWKVLLTTKTGTNQGIWGDGKSGIFVGRSSGKVMHYNGSAWNTLDSGTHHSLEAVWGGASRTFFVGSGGTILEYQGKAKP